MRDVIRRERVCCRHFWMGGAAAIWMMPRELLTRESQSSFACVIVASMWRARRRHGVAEVVNECDL